MSVRHHRSLVDLALLLATVATILGATAYWVAHDLLDVVRWTQTSGRVIDRPAVRRAVSGFTVSRALGAAGVDSALDQALPSPVAGDAQRALHRAAGQAAAGVLASREGRRAWQAANHQAVAGFVGAVDHPDRHEGVSLQLTPLLSDLLAGVAAAPFVREIPGASSVLSVRGVDAGRLQLLSPGEVHDVAPGVRAVRVASWALPLVAVALLLFSLLLAAGWRSIALSRCGYALLIAGGALLGLRALAQYGLAEAFVNSATDRAAVRVAWLTATVGLRTEAIFLLIAGGIVAVGSWLIRAIL